MDENKNVNNDTQTSNNMDYSFDFANQVEKPENDVVQAPEVAVQTTEAPVAPEVTVQTTEAPIAPEAATQTTEAPVAPEVTLQNGEVPATPETSSDVTPTTENSEEDIELIKDKKATKRFLIILFVIILAFIIALPFIFNIMG